MLRDRGIPFAVVGAVAMAVHGVSRSTRDLDLLALSQECLETSFWESVRREGTDVRIRKGDRDDPLAGVVRFGGPGESPLDLVVGKSPWQAGILRRARLARIEGADVPVAAAADLILLKLYAGGPQDAWDIEQLLEGPDRAALIAEVGAALTALPPEFRRLWARVRGGAPGSEAP
jgi:hypothetical protein